jgi:hypothetical protein
MGYKKNKKQTERNNNKKRKEVTELQDNLS